MEVTVMMRMRTRLTAMLVLSLLVATPAVDAEQPAKVHRIGFLGPTPAPAGMTSLEAFRAGLRDLGYVEGKNIVIETRWAEDKFDRLDGLAAELVGLKVDVLVTYTTPGALAAKRATMTVPIVMATSTDAVATGIVASLARSGGNVTGGTFMGPELYLKQLDLLKAVVPNLRRTARLVNPDNVAVAKVRRDIERVAASMKIETVQLEVRAPGDFGAAFTAAATRGVEAVVISADPMFLTNSKSIADIAMKKRLPSIGRPVFAKAGGLLGFGPIPFEEFRRASYFVDRILKGAKPADLPVEQPTKFELVINLTTAKVLGLTISPSLLLRADRVIE